MGKTLQFNKDQNLSIEGAEYRVTGGIEFHNRSDGSRCGNTACWKPGPGG